jgi:flavin reductase (DIM6/NTAB) family NADH-FMN oxidoreductase RutF
MLRTNPAAFRQAASRFVTGVTVLTALDAQGEVCGMTANSFVTVSLSPPTVLVSVMPGRMHQAISASGRYGVNVLPEDGRELSQHFSGRPAADASPAYDVVEGLPRLPNCVAFFACEVTRIVDVSDHTLFIAEVSSCDYCDNAPLVFFSSRYHPGPGAPFEPNIERSDEPRTRTRERAEQ